MKLKVKKLHPKAKLPTYGSNGAACFDLYAATINDHQHIGDIVYPGHPVIADTGLAFEVPEGYMLQIRSRSGLAFNAGIEAFHGTVDSDFRGPVKVRLSCAYLGDEDAPHKIHPGDRVAQACLVATPRVEFVEDELTDTERGEGGFGSSGT